MSWPIVNVDRRSPRLLPSLLRSLFPANNFVTEKSSSKKVLPKLKSNRTAATSTTGYYYFCLTSFLLLISFALINSSLASPVFIKKQPKNMNNNEILLKNYVRQPRLLRRIARATASGQQSQSSPAQACLIQLVERRSCRPMSAPVDWDVDIVDDSSATVEPSDTAEVRYHETGYNAPSLRLTPYNDDPNDESTYFIERPVPGKPGIFTLQTLSTREFVCISRRGRLRLQQAPAVKRRCWWIAGKMTFGTYGQQRHSIALISARHYPKIGEKNITQNTQIIKLTNASSLSSHWVVGFRRDGRPLPAYAPKVIQQSQLIQHAGADNIAFDTFLFTRLVASHDVHEAHGFNSNSCSESIQRHNNYARHLVFC